MRLKSTLLAMASVAFFATAQAQVKVGANPGTITSGAVLDVEGTSGRTVIRQNGSLGVNTTSPDSSADLDLKSTNKALLLNRVANTAAVANPKPGMMIYDLSANCVKVYQGNPATWSGCLLGKLNYGQGGGGNMSLPNYDTSVGFLVPSVTQASNCPATETVPYRLLALVSGALFASAQIKI